MKTLALAEPGQYEAKSPILTQARVGVPAVTRAGAERERPALAWEIDPASGALVQRWALGQ